MATAASPSPLLFVGAAEVATCTGPPRSADGDPAGARTGVAVLTRDGKVVAVGEERDLSAAAADAVHVDCQGGTLTPGFVDSHTHAVFGHWRADEYVLRCRGLSYMEIAARGGGINASVRDLRARSEDELIELTLPRLGEMLRNGTTTAEIKSGYGLTTVDELKILRVIRRLAGLQPITLIATFLGAHEVPPEYRERRGAYVDLLVDEMIPAIAHQGIAEFCDVFMEPGVFDADDSTRILTAGLAAGLQPKIHADELGWSGGAELAVQLGAASADHLGSVSKAGIAALASSPTVATLLPSTLFFLGRDDTAPARALLDAGATVALATDFNPGSSPTVSIPFVLTAACSRSGMEPAEAVRAATAGGAAAVRLRDGSGTIAPDAPADLVLWRAPDSSHLAYRLAGDLLMGVWKGGVRVA